MKPLSLDEWKKLRELLYRGLATLAVKSSETKHETLKRAINHGALMVNELDQYGQLMGYLIERKGQDNENS